MDYLQLMKDRHSVRQYKDIPLSEEDVKLMKEKVDEVNKKSGLDFKFVINEPRAFSSFLPKYGSFKNVTNYIICSGKDTPDFEQKYGYKKKSLNTHGLGCVDESVAFFAFLYRSDNIS